MFAWDKRAVTRASDTKYEAAVALSVASRFSAISRPSERCTARQTSPIPPRPSSETISYASPSFVAARFGGGVFARAKKKAVSSGEAPAASATDAPGSCVAASADIEPFSSCGRNVSRAASPASVAANAARVCWGITRRSFIAKTNSRRTRPVRVTLHIMTNGRFAPQIDVIDAFGGGLVPLPNRPSKIRCVLVGACMLVD